MNEIKTVKVLSRLDAWNQVMSKRVKGAKEARGVANTLNRDDLNTILGTADFFGASEAEMAQIWSDLAFCRYRVFDWLAMAIHGRCACDTAVKVFVYSFLKVDGVPSEFIKDLQTTDYDIVRDWESVILE
jgi:hypothetical protein